MATNAVIGSLRAVLGLDTAQFDANLARTKASFAGFGRTLKVGLAGVATAGIAAGAALSVAVKSAIDSADKMGELAQSVGVSVEALSRLGYAAKMSGSDLDGVATGLKKLSQTLFTAGQNGTGAAATAFSALGVSVKNADGSLRSADSVLLSLADKFAMMEDGTLKTSLAMQLFGKSGTDLIPFLNQGSAGIKKLTDEADRLGITISGETANAAGDFNDTLDRLQAVFTGLANKIMKAALPALNSLVETLASPEFAAAMQDFATLCINTANAIAQTFIAAHQAFKDFMSYIDGPAGGAQVRGGQNLQQAFPDAFGTAQSNVTRDLEFMNQNGTSRSAADLYKGFGLDGDGKIAVQEAGDVLTELALTMDDFAGSASGASAAAKALKDQIAEGKAVFEATRTPQEEYAAEVARLNGLLNAGAINQDTYNRAVLQAQEAFDSAAASADKMAQSANAVGQTAGEGLRGLIDGTRSWNDALADVLSSLAEIAFKSIDFGGGAGGGLISGLLGGLLGFANGGSFNVGGSGGTDSQLVAFKATPNENVTITKPGQDAGGSGGAIIVDVQVGVQNGSLVPLIANVSGQIAGQQIKANNKQLPNLMQDIQMRQG